MRTMKGTVFFNPLEGGIWALEDGEGNHYQLDGIGPDARGEGRKLTVVGEVADDMMGIGMVYPIFKVQSYTVDGQPDRKR
jgi:hypothetical protein